MDNINIRPYQDGDKPSVLALNAGSVSVLSPMDAPRLDTLHTMAKLVWVVETQHNNDVSIAAFFIGFDENSQYDSVNYQWFKQRLKNFLYIDRIVVDQGIRSRGLGKYLYQHITTWAQDQDIKWLAAEIDMRPPNTPSLNFHKKQGFIEIGCQEIDNGKKQVSLCAKSL